MDLVVRLLDAVERVVEQHQHIMVLFSEREIGGIDADLE
jgi:hypothetical protein